MKKWNIIAAAAVIAVAAAGFGGAYAAFNSYATGADIVLALPTTRVAVMGPAGKEYVYKDELRGARARAAARAREEAEAHITAGLAPEQAQNEARRVADEWLKAQETEIGQRYERELMNPREALSLGSISEIVMPHDLRAVLGRNLDALLRSYVPGPMTGPQREFH